MGYSLWKGPDDSLDGLTAALWGGPSMGHWLVWAFLPSPTVELSLETSWPDNTVGKWLSVCTQFQAGSQQDHQDSRPPGRWRLYGVVAQLPFIMLGGRQHCVVSRQLGVPEDSHN